MSANATLAVAAGLLFGAGVYLLMARGIVRAFLGVLLMGNGINLLFLIASGAAGRPPIIIGDDTSQEGMADPLPQALVLTAIVITVAMTGYVLALAYRATRATASDAIEDDTEDARIVARATEEDLADDGEIDTLANPQIDDLPPGLDDDPARHGDGVPATTTATTTATTAARTTGPAGDPRGGREGRR